jgi:L-ascorbate metabolism protein UlaG (beta-lactamase superfamily)
LYTKEKIIREDEQGTLWNINGIEFLAPPPPKDKKLIINYNKPIKQQKWVRQELPDYWKELRLEEKKIQEQEWKEVQNGDRLKITHVNPLLERYRQEEWRRRKHGVHIMIKGQCIYLTGAWYYYLQWCKFDHAENNGYPLFYISQRKRFWQGNNGQDV